MPDKSVFCDINNIQGGVDVGTSTSAKSAEGNRIYKFRRKYLPVILGGMMCFSFGLLLGWPSPIFLKLLAGESPAVIFVFSTSSLLAAYLMIGHIFGSFFSIFNRLGLNVTLLFGALLESGGWAVVFVGDGMSLDWLYAGRFLVGFGNGFAFEKTKAHVLDLHGPERGPTLNKLLAVFQWFGVLAAFCIGPFVSGPVLNLCGLIISAFIFTALFLIPREHRGILELNSGNKIVPGEEKATSMAAGDFKWCRMIYRVIFLILLVFVQQFTGLAACIVYNQFIFTEFKAIYPELFSIIYAILLIGSNLVGNFYMASFNKKYCLIFSNVSIVLILFAILALIYAEVPIEKYYLLAPLFFLYIICHTIGLGVVPFGLGPLLFSKKYRRVVSHVQIMFFCAFAIIITKLFQVTFDAFGIFGPFALYCLVAICGVPLVLFFIPQLEDKQGIVQHAVNATDGVTRA